MASVPHEETTATLPAPTRELETVDVGGVSGASSAAALDVAPPPGALCEAAAVASDELRDLVVMNPYIVSVIVSNLVPEDMRSARLVCRTWCDVASTSSKYRSFTLDGTWRGSGYEFGYRWLIDLDKNPDGNGVLTAKGEIQWQLTKTPAPDAYLTNKVGSRETEWVRGTFNLRTRMLEIEGFCRSGIWPNETPLKYGLFPCTSCQCDNFTTHNYPVQRWTACQVCKHTQPQHGIKTIEQRRVHVIACDAYRIEIPHHYTKNQQCTGQTRGNDGRWDCEIVCTRVD
ncbi:hypothetical protein Pelo_11332 [Pelomyxa schiedti]|nr:hypothetical protein Pelo_11332 [Pelomyxa schiedti]